MTRSTINSTQAAKATPVSVLFSTREETTGRPNRRRIVVAREGNRHLRPYRLLVLSWRAFLNADGTTRNNELHAAVLRAAGAG
jgi:ribosomal protein L2